MSKKHIWDDENRVKKFLKTFYISCIVLFLIDFFDSSVYAYQSRRLARFLRSLWFYCLRTTCLYSKTYTKTSGYERGRLL